MVRLKQDSSAEGEKRKLIELSLSKLRAENDGLIRDYEKLRM